VEHALSKGASAILMPVSCRRQLVDLSDDVATKVRVLFYSDAPDRLRKVLHDGQQRRMPAILFRRGWSRGFPAHDSVANPAQICGKPQFDEKTR
jgi:hypothetical protein